MSLFENGQDRLETVSGNAMDRVLSGQSTQVSSSASISSHVQTTSYETVGELPIEASDLESRGEVDATSLRRSDIKGLRRVIFNFTPQWFLITMGTGNVALILLLIPFQAKWLYWLSVIVFGFDVFLFISFFSISLLRYILYPRLVTMVLRHPMQSLFLGPFTVSFAAITNLLTRICIPAWGSWVTNWAWTFWWIDSVMAVAVLVGVMFCVLRYHNHAQLDEMVAVWLLPSISAIVAASSGALVASALPPEHAFWTFVVSFFLWGVGFPMAMIILAMYFHRLSLRFSLSESVIFSVFLPLGPLAQGAHATMELGKVALRVFPITKTLSSAVDAGQIIYVFGWLTGFILWSFAVLWLLIAFATLVDRRWIPFNLGWWSVVFPTGVLALSTLQIGQLMPSLFFNVLGTVFTTMNILVWLSLIILTLKGIWDGSLFGRKGSASEAKNGMPT